MGRRAAARRATVLALLSVVSVLAAVVGPNTAWSQAAAFPAVDLVLLVDVSSGMGLPTELPADFPDRERYERDLALLITFFTEREAGIETEESGGLDGLREAATAARIAKELADFQRDLEAYTQTNALDPEALTRLTAGAAVIGRSLDSVVAQRAAYGARGRVGLVAFSDRVVSTVPLTEDTAAIRREVDGLTAAGSANLAVGLQAALDQLAGAAPAGSAPRKQIVLLSGSPVGPAIASRLPALADRARAEGVVVDTIGLGLTPGMVGQDHLVALAQGAGGGFIFAKTTMAAEAAALSYRSYADGRVLARLAGTVRAGQRAEAGNVVVPPQSGALRVALASLVGTARSATPTPAVGQGAGGGIGAVLVAPDGARLAESDPRMRARREGGVLLLAVDDPQPGEWRVELSAGGAAGAAALRYALVGSTDGVSDARPIELAPPDAVLPPPPGPLDDPADRRLLVLATGLLAGVAAFLFLLAMRGWTRRNASTAGGCAAGCGGVGVLLLIGLVWGVVWVLGAGAALLGR